MTRSSPLSRDELVQRIEALRVELAESPTSDDAPCGVSGRNVSATVAAAERMGIAREQLEDGLPFALGPAERASAWITWEDFGALLGRIGAIEGDRGLERLGEQALESPLFRAVGVIAGALLTERDLYEWVTRMVFVEGSLYFSGVDGRVEARSPRRLQIIFESWGAVFTRPFALAMAGIVSSSPRMVGRPPAEVSIALAPDRLVLDVRLAKGPTLGASLRERFVHGRSHLDSSELRRLYTELVEKNQRLLDKVDELEASRAARREMETRLAQVRQMRVVGRFAGVLAHEFNNLLTVIVALADLLRAHTEEGSADRRAVDTIMNAASRAAALTRGLRELGGGEHHVAEPVDLRRVVEEARPLLEGLLGPGMTLRTSTTDEAAGARIDAGAAERILANLVVNADEATPDEATVWVEVRRVELDHAFVARHPGAAVGEHVLLSVRDDGVGMPEAVRARVFEPFFSTKTDAEGRGLGLATVYSLVSTAGGTIWADSAPGEGTEFRVYLPRVSLSDETSRPDRAAAGEAIRSAGSVLLIDDNDMVRETTTRLLRRASYAVTTAASGDEALQLVEQGLRPTIIVSDVVMPGLRGQPLAAALRAKAGPVPILFVSGWAEQILDGDLGPDTELLAKPFSADELLGRLAALARDAEGR